MAPTLSLDPDPDPGSESNPDLDLNTDPGPDPNLSPDRNLQKLLQSTRERIDEHINDQRSAGKSKLTGVGL